MDDWESYWAKPPITINRIYDKVAVFYRHNIIRPQLRRYLNQYMGGNKLFLHAGCGSGQVEEGVVSPDNVIALDISVNALGLYKNHHPGSNIIRSDIMSTGFKSESFDGIYNLGVMEHFSEDEINNILHEFNRILKPGGVIILIWPPKFGASVLTLRILRRILTEILKTKIQFHPPEPNLIRSHDQVESLINRAGFKIHSYEFGIRDLFTNVVIVIEKNIP